MDGVDFERVARKTSKETCTNEAKHGSSTTRKHVLSVFTWNTTPLPQTAVREFVLHGTESGTPVQPTPAVSVPDFKDTEYAKAVTEADTIAEVQGIISRRIGEAYVDWFTFELKDAANGYDYYDVEARKGKIHITGNNGVSLATGLNAYPNRSSTCTFLRSAIRSKCRKASFFLRRNCTRKQNSRFAIRITSVRFPIRWRSGAKANGEMN